MADVELKVGIDTSEATKGLEALNKTAAETQSSLTTAFKAIGAAGAAAVAFFAGREVVKFFEDGTEAAIKQQEAMNDLAQQLKLTGSFSQEALDHFQAFGDQMEKTSKFADDVVISQVAVAKSMGLTNEQSEKLVKASIELSAVTKESLSASVEELGRTFKGVEARSPVLRAALRDVGTDGLKAGQAIDEVLKRFGGSAAAEIDTFAGSVTQAKNAFSNFQESIGKIIIENPAVIAAIKAFKDIFGGLQGLVESNSDKISDFITTGIKVLATSISTLVPIIGFFARALEGLASVATLAFGGLTEVVSLAAQGFIRTTGFMVDSVLALTDSIGLTSNAQGKFESFSAGAVLAIEKISNSTAKFASDNVDKFESFNKGFEGFEKSVDDAAQKIFDAHGKIATSAKASGDAQAAAFNKAKLSAKDLEAALKEFKTFQDKVTTDALSDSGKVIAQRNKELAELKALVAKDPRIASAQKVAELRTAIESAATDKILEINRKADEQLQKQAEDAANKRKDAIAKIAASPAVAALEGVKPANISEGTAKGVAAGVGVANDVLGGKEGARSLLASVGGAAADAFIPGIGAAVGPLISALSQGPEAVKALVKGFVDAIPQLINAIADSIPTLVDTLIDTLITHGGIIKIAEALVRASFAISLGLVGHLGEEMFKQVKFDSFGASIGGGIIKGVKKLFEIDKQIREAIIKGAEKLFEFDKRLRIAVLEALQKIGSSISNAFAQGAQNLFTAIRNAIQRIFEFDKQLRESIAQLVTGLFQKFEEFDSKLRNTFADALRKIGQAGVDFANKIKDGFVDGIHRLTDWLSTLGTKIKDSFLEAIAQIGDKIKEALSGLFGGGGGGGGVTGLGFATGITEVPKGFPNDSFKARLTSGERVVDTDSNSDLKTFLASASEGLNLSPASVTALARMLAEAARQGSGGGQDASHTIELKLNGAVLAKQILKLNQRNERLTG